MIIFCNFYQFTLKAFDKNSTIVWFWFIIFTLEIIPDTIHFMMLNIALNLLLCRCRPLHIVPWIWRSLVAWGSRCRLKTLLSFQSGCLFSSQCTRVPFSRLSGTQPAFGGGGGIPLLGSLFSILLNLSLDVGCSSIALVSSQFISSVTFGFVCERPIAKPVGTIFRKSELSKRISKVLELYV